MIGEDSQTALKREFKEELGVDIYIDKYLGTIENFFEYNGKKYHELMLVYEAKFDENSKIYKQEKVSSIEENSNLEFIWKTIEDIKDMDLKPKFLKDSIVNKEDINHLINK